MEGRKEEGRTGGRMGTDGIEAQEGKGGGAYGIRRAGT